MVLKPNPSVGILKGTWLRFVFTILAVVVITASISHGLLAWLKIRSSFGEHWVVRKGDGLPTIYLAGSSLAGALSWDHIDSTLMRGIETWWIAGSSPSEWEWFQHLAKTATLSIIVVSPYDLNEYFLSDFRPEVVPIRQTVKDLWQSQASWSFSKRVLSLYPLAYFRILFPTTGRSDGVMVGIREKLVNLTQNIMPVEREARPTVEPNGTDSEALPLKEKISEWPEGRMIRRLEAMRRAAQGQHFFEGPKHLALKRMLRQAQARGTTIVVVLPVSPSYNKAFLTPRVLQDFEAALSESKRGAPEVHWVRLDRLNELHSDDNFWDLVHMNLYGREIATEALLGDLKRLSALR